MFVQGHWTANPDRTSALLLPATITPEHRHLHVRFAGEQCANVSQPHEHPGLINITAVFGEHDVVCDVNAHVNHSDRAPRFWCAEHDDIAEGIGLRHNAILRLQGFLCELLVHETGGAV